jgi:hypothetical protein
MQCSANIVRVFTKREMKWLRNVSYMLAMTNAYVVVTENCTKQPAVKT